MDKTQMVRLHAVYKKHRIKYENDTKKQIFNIKMFNVLSKSKIMLRFQHCGVISVFKKPIKLYICSFRTI